LIWLKVAAALSAEFIAASGLAASKKRGFCSLLIGSSPSRRRRHLVNFLMCSLAVR